MILIAMMIVIPRTRPSNLSARLSRAPLSCVQRLLEYICMSGYIAYDECEALRTRISDAKQLSPAVYGCRDMYPHFRLSLNCWLFFQ
jgi:hypothetical protein